MASFSTLEQLHMIFISLSPVIALLFLSFPPGFSHFFLPLYISPYRASMSFVRSLSLLVACQCDSSNRAFAISSLLALSLPRGPPLSPNLAAFDFTLNICFALSVSVPHDVLVHHRCQTGVHLTSKVRKFR